MPEADELAKTATMCILDPDTKPVAANGSSLDNREINNPDQEPKRLPIPDPAAQEQALKLVREVFKDKYSATASDKQNALAQELFQKEKESSDDVAAQYVMLKEAGRFALLVSMGTVGVTLMLWG